MSTAEAGVRASDSPVGVLYDGFLSYSHAADDLLAPRLQTGLQRFAKPWWKRRALRIFRDDAQTGAELDSVESETFTLFNTAFDPARDRLAALSQDPGGLLVWDIGSGDLVVLELEGLPGAIEWSPSGRRIAVSGNEGVPRLFDTETREEVLSLPGQTGVVWSLSFNPDGTRLAGAGLASDTLVWDISGASRSGVETLATPYPGLAWVAYTQEGDSIVVLSDEEGTDGTLARIDASTHEVEATVADQASSSFGVLSVPAAGAGLVSSLNADGSAVLIEMETFEPIVALPQGWYALAVTADRTLAALNPLEAFDPSGAPAMVAIVGSWEVLVNIPDTGACFAQFSPDAALLTKANCGEGSHMVIDLASGSVVARFDQREMIPGQFSPDGSLLTATTVNGRLKLLDIAALQAGTDPEDAVVWEIAAHKGAIGPSWAGFSPDGSLVASLGFNDRQLRVWDTQTSELVADFGGFGGDVPGFSFHPDGKHLIVEDEGGTIQVLTIDESEFADVARSRLTRTFTSDECATYRIDPCPTLEEIQQG